MFYPDGHEAASIREAEDAYLGVLPDAGDQAAFARSAFDGLDKGKLRSEMYREQRSLCIFCEQACWRGPPPRPGLTTGIRSVASRGSPFTGRTSICPAPSWKPATRPKATTRFGGTMNLTFPGQWPLRYEDVVGFTSRGEIYVRSDAMSPDPVHRAIEFAIAGRTDGDRVRRGIVNLNDPALVRARSAAVRVRAETSGKELREQNRDQG